MSKSGALFDILKLNDVSKNVISKIKAEDVYEKYIEWAKEYDEEMYKLVSSNESMMKEVFNIDKEGPKPRKDFAKWDDVREKIFYFFDSLFEKDENVEIPKNIDMEEAKRIISIYKEKFEIGKDNDEWFVIPSIASSKGWAKIIHRIYAPFITSIMMSNVSNSVNYRISHIYVRRSHIYFCSKNFFHHLYIFHLSFLGIILNFLLQFYFCKDFLFLALLMYLCILNIKNLNI